jgi:hypothetical protein
MPRDHRLIPIRRPRGRRWGALTMAAGLGIGGLAMFGDSAPARAASTEWTLSVAGPGDVERGDTVTFKVTIAAPNAQRVLVDFEIWTADPARPGMWQRPLQRVWDDQAFADSQSRTFTTTWEVPDDEPLGTHYLKVGVFGPGWTGFLQYDPDAGRLDVVDASPPATTPAPTTTRPPTTTTAPTTSTTTTTTTATPPPLPPPPPAGAQFLATFDTPSDFYGRFNMYAGNFVDHQLHRVDWWLRNGGATPEVVQGDHDMSCGGPDTVRNLDVRNPDWTQYFWYCAPGGDPSKGHVMTGFTTSGYVIFGFSPNRSFSNVHKVCWDINATEEGGGKWTNMVIVPEALYQRFAPRLDYTSPGFNNDGTGDFNIQAEDHPGLDVWGIKDFRGGQHFYVGTEMLMDDDIVRTTSDKAARYQHCVEETSPTTSRLTVARPGGGTSVYDLASGMPDGTVRVIFQDDMYDPVKRDGYSPNAVTWHWDNILIG